MRVGECDTIEGRWKKIKEAFVKTLEESVVKKKRKHKQWVTQATLDKMDERKRVKDKLKRPEHVLRKVGTEKSTGKNIRK